jgi:regulatory protein
MQKPAKYLSKTEALSQLQKYCAYQERCHQDVRYKLLNLGIRGDDLEAIISQLIQDQFLDEERFARAFVRGKFRHKQWGKQKITLELTKRNISNYLKQRALEEIDQQEYRSTLISLISKKKATFHDHVSAAEKSLKLFKFAYQKGYEPDLIYEILGEESGRNGSSNLV